MAMVFFEFSLTTIITIIILFALIYEYVYKFYSLVKLYPKGPMPLPIVGNLLMLRRHMNRHPTYLFQSLAQKYGDLITFWLGMKPIVIISEIGLAKDAFNKYEFCDRFETNQESKIMSIFLGSHNALPVMNASEEFKLLRSLSVQTVRKFLYNNNASKTIHEIVCETVDLIKQQENDNAFVPNKYINSIFIRTVTETIFGKRLAIDDHFIYRIFEFLESFQTNFLRFFLAEYVPLYKYFWNSKRITEVNNSVIKKFDQWYNESDKHNQNANNSTSIAQLLNSAANALRDKNKSETNQYLTESNMIGAIVAFFIGSTDTTYTSFKWILLFLAYYPEMQQRMRNEVNNIIGNKLPDVSDKEKCVFVNAFICESMRMRTTVPNGIAHMTSSDAEIGGKSIPKGTTIMLNQLSILNDSRYWQNPDIFKPERFLDISDMSTFIPFSTGKRNCVGDKFAMNMLFLSLISLLKATNGYQFVLSDKEIHKLEAKNLGLFLEPKLFKVLLLKEN